MRLLVLLTACSVFAAPDVSPRVKWANLPLSFEPTAEQSTAGVHYLTRGSSYSLYLAAGESVLMGKDRSPLRTKLAGANLTARIVAEGPQTSTSNYFVGKDPRQWRTSVPNYDRVRYIGIYPGIDLVYYGRDGRVEYDWIVSPGADAHQIRMVFQGADHLRIDSTGELVVTLGKNQYRHRKPVVYQEVAGKRVQVAGAWNLRGKEGSFRLGGYDHEKPLTIDPTLAYSTYLGGSNLDIANAVAVDPAGNTYITGSAGSTDFPTTSPLQASRDGQGDAFVTKINANGTAKIYSTYLGGGGVDEGNGIAVDSSGNAYVTGSANSLDFPMKNAIQSTYGGSGDAFVAKLNAAGSALVYSTYLGGNAQDYGTAIALDPAANAYVIGVTFSTNFPTANPFQSAKGSVQDAFVTKINADGSAWVYSTFLGGNEVDEGYAIAVDAAGSAYVTGKTGSTNFPLQGPLRSANIASSGNQAVDAFVTKINPAGSALVFSTYLGGSAADYANGIAVDSSGVYVAGVAVSLDFPIVNAFQPRIGTVGQNDAFVAKLNLSGSALIYSTYLGGGSEEEALAMAVDQAGNAWITGRTNSPNFPLKDPVQSTRVAAFDMFVTELSADGSALLFSTYYGGSGSESGQGIAVDAAGNIHVAGQTTSLDFPVMNPIQLHNGGGPTPQDAVVLMFGNSSISTTPPTTSATLTIGMRHDPNPEGMHLRSLGIYYITVTNSGSSPTSGTVTVTETVPAGETLISMAGVGWTCPAGGATCTRGDVLAPGNSSEIIEIVAIAENAATTVTNQAIVSWSAQQSATASDPTQFLPAPAHFFDGAIPVLDMSNLFFLQFPNGQVFGYYSYYGVESTGATIIGHSDMGELYFSPISTQAGAFFYDYTTGHEMYTDAGFPVILDFQRPDSFSLAGFFTIYLPGWISYVLDPSNTNHYTKNPRLFRNIFSGAIFSM